MSALTDPSLYKSNFERIEGDRYFTQPWCTKVLIPHIPEYVRRKTIWEPAAGRGDIVRVLTDEGFDCWASDIDMSEYNYDISNGREENFIVKSFDFALCEDFSAIITNPPYSKSVESGDTMSEVFVRKALELGVDYVAMLLRSEFNSAASRFDLFTAKNGWGYELVLTSRPRWDWWRPRGEEDGPRQSPRHNFSWFVWDRQSVPGPTRYANKGDLQ